MKKECKVVEYSPIEVKKEEVIEGKASPKEKTENTWTCDKCKTVNQVSPSVICKSNSYIVNNRMLSSEQEFAEEAVVGSLKEYSREREEEVQYPFTMSFAKLLIFFMSVLWSTEQ